MLYMPYASMLAPALLTMLVMLCSIAVQHTIRFCAILLYGNHA